MMDMLAGVLRRGDQVLVMSNGGFGGIHDRLLARLQSRQRRASA
jgi:UDP-N-acetylmuramate: L-alanyl-gamma-D-glutamyl-meso-diaminopimelate ligase